MRATDLLIGSNKKILLYGPSGSGKTTQFLTLKGPKFLYLFDQSGRESIAGHEVEFEPFFPDSLALTLATMKGHIDQGARNLPKAKPETYNRFVEHIYEEGAKKQFADYENIGLDSLSTLSAICMDRMLFIENRQEKAPEIQDYLIVGNALLKIFRLLNGLPDKTILVTAHSDLVQDEVSKKVQNQLDIMKNVRRELPKIFTDILITTVDIEAGDVHYKLQTVPSREWPMAKNSMGLPPFVDVTIDRSKPYEGQGLGKLLLLEAEKSQRRK